MQKANNEGQTNPTDLNPQPGNSVPTGDTNAPERQQAFKERGVGNEQSQIADIQSGLQEADQGEFALAEEVRAVFAKYGH